MRKLINILGWISVFFTIITLMLTLLTTYQFVYVKYFDSYYTLQWSIFITMVIWSIKLFNVKTAFKSILYSVVCIVIAVGTMFFMFMNVF